MVSLNEKKDHDLFLFSFGQTNIGFRIIISYVAQGTQRNVSHVFFFFIILSRASLFWKICSFYGTQFAF